VTADGACDGEPVYRAVAERQPDPPVAVVIPPRSTAVASPEANTMPSQRDQHIHMIHAKGRLGWQKAVGYGQRSHAEMVCLQTINSAWLGRAAWCCPGVAARQEPIAWRRELTQLFREGLALSERIMMRQQWTVTRRQVSHPAAERRWDQAYQLLLAMPTVVGPGIFNADAPTNAMQEDCHARSNLRPGLDRAPGSGPND
jgi:hypothetical protein